MYRLLRAAGQVRELRRLATQPARVKPELVASGPNQTWTWDVTKLERERVLQVAYAAHPERIVRQLPAPAPLPGPAWINKPPEVSPAL